MVTQIIPEINKVYFINKYTLFHILEGTGGIQVDFKNYHDWHNKIIFLDKGQYIKFMSDNFVVRRIEFQDEKVFNNKDVRVLFKHLVSLGYINFNECEECKLFLSNTIFSEKTSDIIDISSKQWYWQNPFHANEDEYHVIFDVKEIVDSQFKNNITNHELTKLINQRGYDAHALFKQKVGISIKGMFSDKRLTEGKKELVFTDKSVKEIGYDLGYKDPAYFNRIFKKSTGKSPNEFRENFEFEKKDIFIQDLYELLHLHHMEQRSLEFYAEKMNMSIKTLSKKVRDKLNISMGQLIRQEITNTSKALMQADLNINEIAYQLGFEEANHFSTFFKHHTGITPSEYKIKKVQ